jgi:hypothetical protein
MKQHEYRQLIPYKSSKSPPKEVQIRRNAKRAAAKAEKCYRFRPKNVTVISKELQTIYGAKIRHINKASTLSGDLSTSARGLWDDRTSLIAAPLSADLFLHTEGAIDKRLAPPKFYIDQLVLPGEVPDALADRFPHSDIAHVSAKRITKLLTRAHVHRTYSASMIQRNFRFWRFRKTSKQQWLEVNQRATQLQHWMKKIFKRLREKHQAVLRYKACILTLQCAIRCAIARRKAFKQREKGDFGRIMLLRYWVRRQMKRWRRKRGRDHRYRIHATRLQRWWRSMIPLLKARPIKAYIRAQGVIARRWRVHYHKTRWPFIVKVITALRNNALRKKVCRMQTLVRMKLGVRYFQRTAIKNRHRERTRAHNESMALDAVVSRACTEVSLPLVHLFNLFFIFSIFSIPTFRRSSGGYPLSTSPTARERAKLPDERPGMLKRAKKRWLRRRRVQQ